MGITSNRGGEKEKGAIFSLDAAIAFALTLLSLLAFASALGNHSSQITGQEESVFLQEKTLMVADSFVKNYNPENGLLGACAVDPEKRRVKSNELDSRNFAGIRPFAAGSFFVKKVSVPAKGFARELDARQGKQCLTVRRFVLVDGEKAIVEVEGCLDE